MTKHYSALFSLGFLCIVSLACAQQNAQPIASDSGTTSGSSSISGIVSDAQTGKPLDDVHVQLVLLPANNQFPTLVYGAISKGDGKFSIHGVNSGNYLLRLERFGFVQVPGTKPADKLLNIGPEARLELKLEMVAAAVLSGEVLDEYGDPLPDVDVTVEPMNSSLLPGIDVIGQGRSDDRGQFRFLVTPGKYRIKTRIFNGGGFGIPETRTDGTKPGKYQNVYFPGTESSASAAIIEAKPGEERSGIEFHLTSLRTLSISGTVSNLPASVVNCGLDIVWGPRLDKMQSGFSGNLLIPGPDGKPSEQIRIGQSESRLLSHWGPLLYGQGTSL